jgi:hypothetical protein
MCTIDVIKPLPRFQIQQHIKVSDPATYQLTSQKEFVMIQQPLETEKGKNHTTVFNTSGQSPTCSLLTSKQPRCIDSEQLPYHK